MKSSLKILIAFSATLLLCLVGLLCPVPIFAQDPSAVDEDRPSEGEIGTVQVYLMPDAARRKIFPRAVRFSREIQPITRGLKADIERQIGRGFLDDTLDVYLGYDQHEDFLGYAIITEEIGKYRPITFMLGITPDFRVKAAAVLVYRESRGGEVRHTRFLRQYRGKSSEDPIRINADIINVSGATMSVRSLNFGIKKLLTLTEQLYRRPK